MKNKQYNKIVYERYISTHFANIHNLNRINEEYEKTYLFWNDYIHRYLPKNLDASFLDLGCGLGHNLFVLKKFGYKNVKGVDTSPECVKFCKAREFDVQQNDILDFLENSQMEYDVIICFDVLEHFTKDKALQLVSLVKSRLKRSGFCLILIPNANNFLNLRLRYADITHEVFYTPESVKQLMRCAGFKKVEVVGLNNFSLSDKSILRTIFKIFIALPISRLSEFCMRIFYLSQGLTDVNFLSQRMLVICK